MRGPPLAGAGHCHIAGRGRRPAPTSARACAGWTPVAPEPARVQGAGPASHTSIAPSTPRPPRSSAARGRQTGNSAPTRLFCPHNAADSGPSRAWPCHARVRPTGPCSCWRTSWWHCRWSTRLPRKPCGRLQKNEMQPWRQQTWCLKTEPDADFVLAMETVLDTCQRPLDPRHPVVCVDELSKTRHAHVRSPQAPEPAGRPARTTSTNATATATCA